MINEEVAIGLEEAAYEHARQVSTGPVCLDLVTEGYWVASSCKDALVYASQAPS